MREDYLQFLLQSPAVFLFNSYITFVNVTRILQYIIALSPSAYIEIILHSRKLFLFIFQIGCNFRRRMANDSSSFDLTVGKVPIYLSPV